MSKGLVALKHLYAKLSARSSIDDISENLKEYDIIEKELKALEIIKNKHISKYAIDTFEEDWNLIEIKGKDLTKEECDLLIEVLK